MSKEAVVADPVTEEERKDAFAAIEEAANDEALWTDKASDAKPAKADVKITNADGVKRKPGRPKKVVNEATAGAVVVAPKASTSAEAVATEKKPVAPKVILTPRQQFIADVLEEAGIEKLPEIETLFAGKNITEKLAIVDIAVLSDSKTNDAILNELKGTWKAVNTLHPSADINMKNVYKLAIQILQDKHIYMPIEVTRTHGTLQCWAGRHRLVVLAILYGLDVVIPVNTSNWNETTAKNAAVVANQARRPLTLEKSENSIVQKMHGRNLNDDEKFAACVVKKADYPDYAVYCVLGTSEYGLKLHFKLADDVSRAGGITTVANLKGFWKAALLWNKATLAKDFNEELTETVAFLNAYVAEIEQNKKFDAKQHLSAKSMQAAGLVFRGVKDSGKNPMKVVATLADEVVAQGEIGTQAAEATHRAVMPAVMKAAEAKDKAKAE